MRAITLPETPVQYRWIPVADAADLIGKRFHDDWSASDPAMLEFDELDAPDREAWHRANHVEETLHRHIAGGLVTAYASADDGAGMTNLPLQWVTDPVFTLCLRTGRFRQTMDVWEPLWIDLRELNAVIPAKGKPRKKQTYEWDKIVHEAWRFALGCEAMPTNAEIVIHLGKWCPANQQEVPDGSHLSKVAKTVLDFLKENKAGRQLL